MLENISTICTFLRWKCKNQIFLNKLTSTQLPPCLHIYKTIPHLCFLLYAGSKNMQQKNTTVYNNEQSASTSSHPSDSVWSSETFTSCINWIWSSTVLCCFNLSYTRRYRKQAIALAITREPRFNSWWVVVIGGVPNGRSHRLDLNSRLYQPITNTRKYFWYNPDCQDDSRGMRFVSDQRVVLPDDSWLSQPQEHCVWI